MLIKTALAAGIIAMLSFTATRQTGEAMRAAGEPSAEELRAKGPAALDGLFAKRDALIARRDEATAEARPALDRELVALDSLIDQVGGQKYCTVSRLYWYTDFERAKAAAKESGRPIVSLRMMGKLTDEYSCANSRFFRATLYANRGIAKTLRERFVLHWASVRPVPKVTVDYGDGRKLHRTLTGNSIHWALDAEGRVIDGLPGLYSPQRFVLWLDEVAAMHRALETMPPDAAKNLTPRWHTGSLAGIAGRWEADLEGVRARAVVEQARAAGGNPPAEAAMVRAVTKSTGEMPILPLVTAKLRALGNQRDATAWDRIGEAHAAAVSFDDDTIEFIRRLGSVATRPPESREAAFDRLIAELERSVAVDTVRNEYDFHARIHEWLAASPSADVEALNDRVYAELFLTPRTDPWIGLRPDDAFTALADDGVEMGERCLRN